MSGHTPGPWEVRDHCYIDGVFDVYPTHGGKQPDVGSWSEICTIGDGAYEECAEANARLIAAAPDLFSELQVREGDLVMLRRAIEEGDPKAELLFRIDDMIRETRAAIAKAEAR